MARLSTKTKREGGRKGKEGEGRRERGRKEREEEGGRERGGEGGDLSDQLSIIARDPDHCWSQAGVFKPCSTKLRFLPVQPSISFGSSQSSSSPDQSQ